MPRRSATAASSYIENALALDPNNAWAWHRYAWVALYKEEPDRAQEAFERSLMLSPLDPLAFNLQVGIAMVMSWKGEYAQSARLLREVLNKHPRLTWAYRQLAFASALAGDLPTARDAIKTLRAAHPDATIASMRATIRCGTVGILRPDDQGLAARGLAREVGAPVPSQPANCGRRRQILPGRTDAGADQDSGVLSGVINQGRGAPRRSPWRRACRPSLPRP